MQAPDRTDPWITRLIVGALFLLTLSPSALAVCPDVTQFGPAASITTGWNPPHVAIGDFNEDGAADLAVAVSFRLVGGGPGTSIAIILGHGNGTFDPPVHYPAGIAPRSIALGDFNEDGITDLAVANQDGGNVSILLGLGAAGVGNGTFGAPTNYPAGPGPFQVRTGDFNEDGIADLVVSNNAAFAVSVLLGGGSGGVGNGTFLPPSSYLLTTYSTGLAIGDFDSNGILDIVATENYNGTIAVLIGQGVGGIGNGSFAPAVHYNAGPEPFDITVHDFDADGISDLAVANTSGGGVAFMRGNGITGAGNGTFAPPQFLASGNTTQATAGDVNQDGITDLLASIATSPGKIRLYLGQGTGLVSPTEFGDPTDYAVGGDPIQAVLGNFNADGKLDCAVPNYFDDDISVLLGTCEADPRAPVLTRVRDVPNDQGGRVFVTWTRSSLDVSGGPVTSYRVWRRIPAELAVGAVAGGLGSEPAPRWIARPVDGVTDAAVEYWEPLATLPAQRMEGYGYTAATTQDSLPGSNPYTAFFITALTGDFNVFYSSNVDSGYSVDNLAPSGPQYLVAQAAGPLGVALHWDANAATDLLGYRLYRGDSPNFVPKAGDLISSQPDTGYVDPKGAGHTYKLTAVDTHGNESPYAVVSMPATTAVDGTDLMLALHGVWPNPSLDGELRVSFTLPGVEPARLTLVDAAGRQVASRWVTGAGRHMVLLAPSGRLSSGVYLVRLDQGKHVFQAKAVILE